MRGEFAETLIRRSPNAFTLLAVIAMRARYASGSSLDGLTQGQAQIGDHANYGMTEKAYRCAKELLSELGLARFEGKRRGTIATLLDERVFRLGCEGNSSKRGERFSEANSQNGADMGRTWGGQGATKKKERRKEREEGGENPTLLSFPFSSWESVPAEVRDRILRDSGKDECFCRAVFEEFRGRKLNFADKHATRSDWAAVLAERIVWAARPNRGGLSKHAVLTDEERLKSEHTF